MAKYIQLTLSLSSFIAIAISSVIAVLFSYFNPFFPFKLSTFNPSITLAPHSLIMLNQASWIPAAKAIVYLDDKTEIPKPEPGEVLVKVRCIAFSPIDSKIQKYVACHANEHFLQGFLLRLVSSSQFTLSNPHNSP